MNQQHFMPKSLLLIVLFLLLLYLLRLMQIP
jgi:hypothetical protein